MSEDEHMAKHVKEHSHDSVHDTLFSPGWLDRHIDTVAAQLAKLPPELQPQLIGPRAKAMHSAYTDHDPRLGH